MQKTLIKLELHRVLDLLANLCTSSLGKERVENLTPITDLKQLLLWQQETTEARDIWRLYPNLPLGGIRDIRVPLRRVELGASLEPSDFLLIDDTIKSGRRLRRFCLEMKEAFVNIKKYAEQIVTFPDLESAIEKTFDPEGNVKDEASSELFQLRRKSASLNEKIRLKLENIIHSKSHQKYLQDTLVTIRGDRYVIPVKQEYRNHFPGIVHDQSSSGATVFIEPNAVVELNNELRTVLVKEKHEVARILKSLTLKVKTHLDDLRRTLDNLALLDLIFAKGKLSEQMDGIEPLLNEDGQIRLIKARHPLIQGSVVPITVELGYDFHTLVITGPNTGGKTVSLKTVGLLCLMTQVGLHIPAEVGSNVAIFDHIFADIGDEQSIEQSLSTFSAHMKNIIDIVGQVNSRSLVLLDELGAGTDPTEGAALARALLEFFHETGAKTIATTHYSELKTFAYSTPGVKNASVEFDTVSLRPTYKLLIGLPGRSNALEIALQLGLPKQLVANAKRFITKEELHVSDMIQDIEENRRAALRELGEIEVIKKEIKNLKDQLEKERQILKEKENSIIEKALAEAEKIVNNSKREAEDILNELRSNLSLEAARAQEKLTREAKERLKQSEELIEERKAKFLKDEGRPLDSLKVGQKVLINSLGQKGTVLSLPNQQGEVLVQAGIMKINVSIRDLRRAKDDEETVKINLGYKNVSPSVEKISNELDLRGLTVDEALDKVDKYLDNAVLSNLNRVYLIHGKGTGALRKAIQEHLKHHVHVKSQRLGEQGEGGTGVTVVDLKV